MLSFRKFLIMSVLSISCFSEEYINDSLNHDSCCYLINIYNETNYPINIFVQKGYESQVKYSFMKEKEIYFTNILDNITQLNASYIKFKYLDKRCYELNNIFREQNIRKKEQQLVFFKEKLFKEYQQNIKEQIAHRFKYHAVEGCQNFASSYYNSVLNLNKNNYEEHLIIKSQYDRCLNIKSRNNLKKER